jgi:hypothetical protein
MATLADLIRWRDSLVESRLSGIRELRDQSGETIIYKSDAEMAEAILAVNRAIQALDRPPVNTILFRTSKGI